MDKMAGAICTKGRKAEHGGLDAVGRVCSEATLPTKWERSSWRHNYREDKHLGGCI